MPRKHHKTDIVTGPCTYCEEDRGPKYRLTEDHVIPQCLWASGHAPYDAPIAYACRPCNNSKKNQDDTFLRDMLVMDTQVFGHPIASDILDGPIMRAVRQEQYHGRQGTIARAPGTRGYIHSPIGHMVAQGQGHNLSVMSPQGVYLGNVFKIDLPADRVWRTFSTIVRGLYFAYVERPLPQGVRVSIKRVGDLAEAERAVHQIIDLGGVYKQAGDGKVFQCVYGVVKDRPDQSLWFLAFYEKLVFMIHTEDPNVPAVEAAEFVS